ncbi:MAG: fatty acid desaturase, partial [Planctomycetota bacterium]
MVFLIRQRWPSGWARGAARRSVWLLNLMLAAKSLALVLLLGWPFLFIELAMIAIAGAVGIWLFYVQHQFENAYWESGPEWDVGTAALSGSSFFHLPRLLRWFSADIGYHHIHHLSSRIPNYYLERCHRAHPFFETVPTLSLRQSLGTADLRLWDPETRKLISFRSLREREPDKALGS